MPQSRWDGFGERLRSYRLAAGLTQEELAEKSGLSVRAIADMESGRTSQPRRGSLERITEALQIPAAERRETTILATGPGPVVPRQLPTLATHFTGRAAELKELDDLLDRAQAEMAGTAPISAIVGTAGAGKSALAVCWAQRVAERFPDGQLYANLRGYDPAQPMVAAEALAGFLRALGVPGQDIPPEAGERAALYRSLMAGRRILVVADNARSAEQVRPLLPAGPLCATVVTSRDALAGLVARDGARRLRLDQLPAAEALDLLRILIGERVDADPGAAATLAELCSRLPLPLRVAAELVISRPAAPLADVAGELANQERRLDLLNADGDPQTAVRAVFSWSYQVLDAEAGRAFRLLGLNPGPLIDVRAAAALTGTTVEVARRILETLCQRPRRRQRDGGRAAGGADSPL